MKWANELFSEIDEQIERILVKEFIYSIKEQFSFIVFLLFVTSFILAILMIPDMKSQPDEKVLFLSNEDVNYFITKSSQNRDHAEKINFIYDILVTQLHNISKKSEKKSVVELIKSVITIKNILLLIPLIIILFSLIFFIKYCYPGSIFLWGDYIDYYNKIINLRKNTWNAIIFALLIGIISNLFVFGLSK